MSRVGKMPLPIPKGVDVSLTAEAIRIKGSLGTLERPANELVSIKNDNGALQFAPAGAYW